MTARTFLAACVAAIPAVATQAWTTQAWAHAPAPLVPTALVEDVKSAAADIEFMDYVGNGQVIRLAPGDVLVLSYLKSCAHETITGGTVMVGQDHSEVQDGQIVRGKVPCDGGKIRLSAQQADKSAGAAFRLQSADIQPVLYARAPLVQLPRRLTGDDRTLSIKRTDRPGEHHELAIDEAAAAAGFYDLAKVNISLARGAIYEASIGTHTMLFKVDAKATSGAAPVVSRLLRFQ
jgi:hypothetical protein